MSGQKSGVHGPRRRVLTAASRGLSEIIRHRRDSYLSDEAVGGLIFDFERVSGGVIDTYHTQVADSGGPAAVRSRRPTSVPSLPYDSSPGTMDVGGLFFEFEANSGCSAQAQGSYCREDCFS